MLLRSVLICCLLPVAGGSAVHGQVPSQAASGPGDLLVAPTRVVFEGRKRSAELNLSNIGTVPATYRVSLIRMEMDEWGAFKEVPAETSPGQVAAESLIRFSPREVTLEPLESQTLRLQLRKPAELAAGEYRLHMVFRAVPPTPEPKPAPGPTEPPKGISIKLIPVYGVAIPMIVRHGETSAKVRITNLVLDAQGGTLGFQLERSGNQSVYGDLKALFLPRSGAQDTLAEAIGVAVYTPNPLRRMVLKLEPPKEGRKLTGGRLRITYSLPAMEGGALLAEGFLDLP